MEIQLDRKDESRFEDFDLLKCLLEHVMLSLYLSRSGSNS